MSDLATDYQTIIETLTELEDEGELSHEAFLALVDQAGDLRNHALRLQSQRDAAECSARQWRASFDGMRDEYVRIRNRAHKAREVLQRV